MNFFLQVLKSFNKMILKTYCKIISNLQKAISILQRLTPTSPLPRFSNLPHLFHFCACVRACIHTHTHTRPLVFFASVCEQAADMILQYPQLLQCRCVFPPRKTLLAEMQLICKQHNNSKQPCNFFTKRPGDFSIYFYYFLLMITENKS